ncbi:hypothetical protein ACFE04_006970 [Oxalis oulophora]
MCSETSPRISFSQDSQSDIPRRDTNLLNSNSDSDSEADFEFAFSNTSLEKESCSADELFANGMILPVQGKSAIAQQIKRNNNLSPALPKIQNPNKEIVKIKTIEDHGDKSKSFWKFTRSNSLKSDVKKICTFPILSRSNSTGSFQNSKKLKQLPSLSRSSLSSSSSSSKPPLLKKNNNNNSNGGYGNGMKISPVLNVPPPPYISRSTANLLGFGFLLRNGKDKKIKK